MHQSKAPHNDALRGCRAASGGLALRTGPPKKGLPPDGLMPNGSA
jgi:hypothetical protein